jgi:hypothetical protein
MADTSPKKKVAAKSKKPAPHPKYSEMVGNTLMRIVSAHIIPYDVHEYLVFQKI